MKSKHLMYKAQITSVLINDYFMTKIDNWERRPAVYVWRKYNRTKKFQARDKGNPYIFGESEE